MSRENLINLRKNLLANRPERKSRITVTLESLNSAVESLDGYRVELVSGNTYNVFKIVEGNEERVALFNNTSGIISTRDVSLITALS